MFICERKMKTLKEKYNTIIVGSGAGGATLAKELSYNESDILVVEAGKDFKRVGNMYRSLKYYDLKWPLKNCRKSNEGIIVWQAIMAGGSTIVSCGNGVSALVPELKKMGIDIDQEICETKKELDVAPTNKKLVSKRAILIKEAANRIGYDMEIMPKFIDYKLCKRCGNCVFGCVYGAKWTAKQYINISKKNGVFFLYSAIAKKIIIENEKATGIIVKTLCGDKTILANNIIISAGGLNTPVLLQKSGIVSAGKNLFIDMFINVYGVSEQKFSVKELPMTLINHQYYKKKGVIISPFVNPSKLARLHELGLKELFLSHKNIIGLMVKIRDENLGEVFSNGAFSKKPTDLDMKKLKFGAHIASKILCEIGVKSDRIIISKIQGAHPGGTAAIGNVVDKNFMTSVNNLYVCDASIMPVAPGVPPIVTIISLAKKLAKYLKVT